MHAHRTINTELTLRFGFAFDSIVLAGTIHPQRLVWGCRAELVRKKKSNEVDHPTLESDRNKDERGSPNLRIWCNGRVEIGECLPRDGSLQTVEGSTNIVVTYYKSQLYQHRISRNYKSLFEFGKLTDVVYIDSLKNSLFSVHTY